MQDGASSPVLAKKQNPLQMQRVLLCLVGPTGFEPIYTEPKSVVLPLDDGPNFPCIGSANIIS